MPLPRSGGSRSTRWQEVADTDAVAAVGRIRAEHDCRRVEEPLAHMCRYGRQCFS